jgi:tetratricopeptide (TPR) repeat protein
MNAPRPCGEWLEDFNQWCLNRPPDNWLRLHEIGIRASIAHDLYYPPELRNAFDLLVKVVYIYVVEFFHPTEWEPVLMDALVQAQELHDRPVMLRVYAALGTAYYAMGRNKKALSAFEITLDRSRTDEFEKMELAAYIGLIRVQATNLSADFEPDLFARALERSQQGAHAETRAALYQALALVCINRWQLCEGLNWARKAFYLWRTIGEDMETAKTCYLLAVGSRMAKRYDRAQYWLKRTETYFGYTPYVLQQVLVDLEAGIVAYENDKHQPAEAILSKALEMAYQLRSDVYIFPISYMLGVSLIELGKLELAYKNLEIARQGWDSQQNNFELVKVYIALSYIGLKMANSDEYVQYLNIAEAALSYVQFLEQRKSLKRIIDSLRNDPDSFLT